MSYNEKLLKVIEYAEELNNNHNIIEAVELLRWEFADIVGYDYFDNFIAKQELNYMVEGKNVEEIYWLLSGIEYIEAEWFYYTDTNEIRDIEKYDIEYLIQDITNCILKDKGGNK